MIKSLNFPLKGILLFGALLFLSYHSLANLATRTKITGKEAFKKRAKPPLDTITVATGDTTITQGAIIPNVINQFSIKIKLKLNYKFNHNIKAKILIEPLKPLQNISLYKDDIDSSITLTEPDWKAKDSTVTKSITLSLQEMQPVTNEQDIILHAQNGKPYFLLRFMPAAIKAKPPTDAKAAAVVKVPGKGAKSTMVTKTPGRPAITLLDSVTKVQLDSSNANTAQQVSATLNLNLEKGSWKNDSVSVTLNPLISSQSIKLLDNDKTYTLKIDSDEWDATKDKIVKKPISFFVQQTVLATDTQYIAVHLKAKDGKGRHIVKLIPFKSKGKAKAAPIYLVKPGNAEIVSDRVNISHYYSSVINSVDTINVKVKLYGAYDAKYNHLYFEFLDTSLSKHFQIINPDSIYITKRVWNAGIAQYRAANKPQATIVKATTVKGTTVKDTTVKATTVDTTAIGIVDVSLKVRTINLCDSINNIRYFDLILKGQTQVGSGSQRVKLSIKDVPFWAEAGTNFNLLDNIKTNNFYAGVYMFDKDIGKMFSQSDNLSFTGGVYESQSVSTNSSSSGGIAYRDLNSVYRDTGTVSANTSVKSIGILVSPHLKLTAGRIDANGLHVFLSYYAEMLWQTVTSNFTYPKNTSIVESASNPNISDYPYKENSISYDFRSQYYGFGLPIYIKENEFNLYINSVVGISNQRFYVYNNEPNKPEVMNPLTSVNYINTLTFYSPNANWNAFYLVQYRLNDVDYGITFSGEIRGLILPNSKPVITLALSKKFDLSKLFSTVFSATK
jgi:hypothetical protein